MACSFFSVSCLDDAASLFTCLETRANPSPQEQQQAASVQERVQEILVNVQQNGLDAVVAYTKQFDAPQFDASMFQVLPCALEQAYNQLPADDKEILAQAIARIRDFHEAQKAQSWFITHPDGSILGQRVTPVDRAGLYIPGGKGGTTPLISSLLMNAIPAQVAGVEQIAVISPPQQDGTVNTTILAAAHMLGITEVYAAGSAWAIAAFAYGAGSLRPVDVIAGPGNIFVATAKRLLIGTVGIDMIAGPSEVLVIADESANPQWIAADMLSQAEHDAEASCVFLCTSEPLAHKVQEELQRQCDMLPRKEIAQKSLDSYGAIVVANNMDVCIEIANKIAPEHLELLVNNPWDLLPKIRHAGAIFMGHHSAEPLGDYFAGPNHVLPTMGTARFSSALGVETFCKKSSIIAASQQFASGCANSVARMARLEGLEAHARSALCRK